MLDRSLSQESSEILAISIELGQIFIISANQGIADNRDHGDSSQRQNGRLAAVRQRIVDERHRLSNIHQPGSTRLAAKAAPSKMTIANPSAIGGATSLVNASKSLEIENTIIPPINNAVSGIKSGRTVRFILVTSL
jgi:hypothetical protein